MNLYSYVGADPQNWTDPFGLDRCFNRYSVRVYYRNGEEVGRDEPRPIDQFCIPGDYDVLPDVTVVGRRNNYTYLDLGLSAELVVVGGFEISTGYTYIVNRAGQFPREVARCRYFQFQGLAGYSAGLGPAASTGSGLPAMRERGITATLSALVGSVGYEWGDTESGWQTSTQANVFDDNVSPRFRVRGRPGAGGTFGGKSTRRFDCRSYGDY
jgi:hypothetical protein